MSKVLVAPMDWGLGHATRCIPLIRALLDLKHQVVIGSSGAGLSILQHKFPNLESIELPSYDPVYHSRLGMVASMGLQLPKFTQTILSEQKMAEKLASELKLDAIISDNRYGLYSKHVPSYFLSHQLNIQFPSVLQKFKPLLDDRARSVLSNFKKVLVPDFPDRRLSGKLSELEGVECSFLGNLSRFSGMKIKQREKEFKYLAILSGPEPQRSVFEKLLVKQWRAGGDKCCLVRGKIEKRTEEPKFSDNIHIINYAEDDALLSLMEKSKVIISRSGYTSIMDYQALGLKKAILVPTPGQTEQEYLADRMQQKGHYLAADQNKFDLQMQMKKIKDSKGFQEYEKEKVSLKEKISNIIPELARP